MKRIKYRAEGVDVEIVEIDDGTKIAMAVEIDGERIGHVEHSDFAWRYALEGDEGLSEDGYGVNTRAVDALVRAAQ